MVSLSRNIPKLQQSTTKLILPFTKCFKFTAEIIIKSTSLYQAGFSTLTIYKFKNARDKGNWRGEVGLNFEKV